MTTPSPEPAMGSAGPTDAGKEDRRITWRAALLALIAAVVAALIGVGSAAYTTHEQVRSQAKQARDEFVRQQRRVAYAAILKDDKALVDATTVLMSSVMNNADNASQSAELLYTSKRGLTYIKATSTMVQDTYTVEVIGSENAYTDAITLDGNASHSLAQAILLLKDDKPSAAAVAKRSAKISTLINKYSQNDASTLEKFVTVARSDLQGS